MDMNYVYAIVVVGILYVALTILLICKFRRSQRAESNHAVGDNIILSRECKSRTYKHTRRAESSLSLYENTSRHNQLKVSGLKPSKTKDADNNVQVLQNSNFYEHITRRPISNTVFENTLQVLKSNNCALLNAEFEDIKMITSDQGTLLSVFYDESKCNPLDLEYPASLLNYAKVAFVQGFTNEKEYIAASSPTKSALSDFWRTVWEHDVRVIVTLCEAKVENRTAYLQLFPEVKQTMIYGKIHVHNVVHVNSEDYTIGDLEVQYGTLRRYIKHMQFHSWTESDCVRSPSNFLSFVEVVRNRVSALDIKTPILVHSCGGLGRIGTFIALDCLTQEASCKAQIDVFNRALRLCSDRMYLVRTQLQYVFIYECVLLFLKTKKICDLSPDFPKSNDYANISITYNCETPYANLPCILPPYENVKLSS